MSSDKKEKDDRESRNAIFGDGVPTNTAQEYARNELGLELPVDAVPLPSRGKAYGQGHPLCNKTDVEYRAMTAREEDLLMSPALIKRGTVITELIKSCLINKEIDVSSLLSGDRNALMIAIRSSGYGSLYEPVYSCPSCDFKNELEVNLSDLAIKPLEIDPVAPGQNLFRHKIPKSGKTIGFKFLTGKEEEEIIAEVEMRKKRGIINSNMVTARLMRSIVEIDGNTDRNLINKFVSYMPAMDSLSLREYIDKHEPGVDMTIAFKCKSCDHFEEVGMPMGPSFFWPNARR